MKDGDGESACQRSTEKIFRIYLWMLIRKFVLFVQQPQPQQQQQRFHYILQLNGHHVCFAGHTQKPIGATINSVCASVRVQIVFAVPRPKSIIAEWIANSTDSREEIMMTRAPSAYSNHQLSRPIREKHRAPVCAQTNRAVRYLRNASDLHCSANPHLGPPISVWQEAMWRPQHRAFRARRSDALCGAVKLFRVCLDIAHIFGTFRGLRSISSKKVKITLLGVARERNISAKFRECCTFPNGPRMMFDW